MRGLWQRAADRAENRLVPLNMLVELVGCAEDHVGLGHGYVDDHEPVSTKCC